MALNGSVSQISQAHHISPCVVPEKTKRLSTAFTSSEVLSASNPSKARLRWKTVKDLTCVNELDIASPQKSVPTYYTAGKAIAFLK